MSCDITLFQGYRSSRRWTLIDWPAKQNFVCALMQLSVQVRAQASRSNACVYTETMNASCRKPLRFGVELETAVKMRVAVV